jgi:hypothetical protein
MTGMLGFNFAGDFPVGNTAEILDVGTKWTGASQFTPLAVTGRKDGLMLSLRMHETK